MIRKLSLMTLCLSVFCHTQAIAAEQFFPQSVYSEFTLPSNEPQVFTNLPYWTVDSKCIILSKVDNIPFSLKVLKKSGSLNGVNLSQGDKMEIIVHPQETIYITAVPGAKVELTNHSEEKLIARCENNTK